MSPFLLFAAAAASPAARPLAVAAPLAALALLPAEGVGALFAAAFCLAAALGGLYGYADASPGERAAGLALAGAAVGVALARTWLELIFFWEAMSVASLVLIWCAGPRARGAGLRYLLVHAAGGTALIFGVVLHLQAGGATGVAGLVVDGRPAGAGAWLILSAVCLNAAVPPLNAWLPDAYPRCTPWGSVLQSAFTTKAAVCVLLRCFAGADVLVPAGAIMAVYGVVYALLQADGRRLLSYHIISQVGYMVAGCGLGTPLAVAGAAAHAFCHILYKALLFMGAGAAERGFTSRATAALYMIGALAISGVPGLNGFVSKPMIVAAASGWPAALLHLASVGTFLSVGLKLPSALFGARREGSPPKTALAAMAAAAALCLATGLYPSWLYERLPAPTDYRPYAAAHVLEALELLTGTALAFLLLRRWLKTPAAETLDTDWLYRKPLSSTVAAVSTALAEAGEALSASARAGAARAAALRPSASADSLSWLVAGFAAAALYALWRTMLESPSL